MAGSVMQPFPCSFVLIIFFLSLQISMGHNRVFQVISSKENLIYFYSVKNVFFFTCVCVWLQKQGEVKNSSKKPLLQTFGFFSPICLHTCVRGNGSSATFLRPHWPETEHTVPSMSFSEYPSAYRCFVPLCTYHDRPGSR